MSWLEEVKEMQLRRELALRLGGPEQVARQHKAGKLTIRQRIEGLLDPGSFHEVGALTGHAVLEDGKIKEYMPAAYICGLGKVDGRPVVVGGEDFTIKGGSGGPRMSRSKGGVSGFVEDMAKEYRLPLVLLIDGVGANVMHLEGIGHTYLPSSADWAPAIELMGMVPVVGGIMGSVAGGPAGRALLSHWTVMVKQTSQIFAAGPPVVRRSLGLSITKEELGGSQVHCYQSGVGDAEAPDEPAAFRLMRKFLGYMPANVWEPPPYVDSGDPPDRREESLLSIVPRDRKKGYDMKRIVRAIVDQGDFFEIKATYGRSVITCLARLHGHVVGIIANNPLVMGGALDAAAADKQGHFIELCDFFHIPIIFLVDIPGLMVGPQAEREGTLRRGMRALYVGYQATVPMMSVIIRKCYGMGGAATGNPSRLNLRLGWPSAEWGSIPIEGGVDAAYRREIENAPDPAVRRAELEAHLNRLRSPFRSAEAFAIEELIDPRDTRPLLIKYLETALPGVRYGLGPKAKVGVRP
ncbi:MAG: propionyl-CoA carboxylase [Chloroflexi bacterium]|nr:propionyl-CoA carboxylase [Chloroflexota bacterium]